MNARDAAICRRFKAGRSLAQLAREYGARIVHAAIREALRRSSRGADGPLAFKVGPTVYVEERK